MSGNTGYDDDALVTGRVAAEIAGVHHNTLYRWIRRGILPARRTPGGKLRVKVGDLHPDKLYRRVEPPAPAA